ncbi:glutamine-hydrolyzing carbamoyl-phosphate synthase small subunit [Phycisphaerales bacterium AB-hyl4]|uniref:Carbamoyl phosphate synthase small chain n=1 Tax=Natronomicrosphaera hydrolytica TaxID=3242702 RepID=A0ABV4U7M2_9BACT
MTNTPPTDPSSNAPESTPGSTPVVARLALEDGAVFTGEAFGDQRPRTIEGEVCFNTSLAGYQEILTDPSYAGQIVTMTYPLIGNYGVNDGDLESARVQPAGFVVRELSNRVSNYRSTQRLEDWLAKQKITGITGIDTRALTRRLRTEGAMNGVLCTDPSLTDEQLVEQARKAPGLVGRNLVQSVSRSEPIVWDRDLGEWAPLQGRVEKSDRRFKVVALDCGAKLNIVRNLVDVGCDVTLVPWDTSPEKILEFKPDGLFVSNGPGDPAAVTATIANLKKLKGKLPTFGICLGHQLTALSMGAKTYKLPFGHRGGNQPVQNLHTSKVEITSQNHGFAVDAKSLEKAGGEPTHINLNDSTLEGFRHKDLPIFAVQYHPEASPGPHDARYLFDCFVEMMRTGQSPTGEQMDSAQRRRNAIAD